MILIQAILWGFAGGVATFLIGTVAGSILAAMLAIPPREGGPGFFALGIGLVASPVGFFGTVLWVLRSRGISFARIGVSAVAIVAGLYLAGEMLHYRNVHSQRHFTSK
jgi:hypothetical protein